MASGLDDDRVADEVHPAPAPLVDEHPEPAERQPEHDRVDAVADEPEDGMEPVDGPTVLVPDDADAEHPHAGRLAVALPEEREVQDRHEDREAQHDRPHEAGVVATAEQDADE